MAKDPLETNAHAISVYVPVDYRQLWPEIEAYARRRGISINRALRELARKGLEVLEKKVMAQ